MRLGQLIDGLESVTAVARRPAGAAGADPEIHRVLADSRRIGPGDAFCAIAGHDADGHRFIPAALAAGAAALIVQQLVESAPVPQVVVENGRAALAYLAHRCLGDPSRQMTVIGVTGTKGKTTITYLVESILRSAGHRCGVLGTIAYRVGGQSIGQRATHVTTPGADEIAEMFARMFADGIRHVVMEVSSHALDQDRVGAVDFDAAIFTNLTGDHRDYHPTQEDYLGAKSKLFERLRPDDAAILNRDAAASETIAQRTRATPTWYGLSGASDVTGQIVQISMAGTRFNLTLPGEPPRAVHLPLIGRHNVSNSLAAAAVAWRLGLGAEPIIAGLESMASVPGRLEPVTLPDGGEPPVTVLVDYAHTDDALSNVLSAVRPLTGSGRLIVVFGCGGDRDATKRPRMAAVAEQWADHIVVTSDNPRSENPDAIIDQIMTGFTGRQAGTKVARQPDRRRAIEQAIRQAEPGDMVLIAGKGHENYQVIGKQKIHFDDREVAAQVLAARFGR